MIRTKRRIPTEGQLEKINQLCSQAVLVLNGQKLGTISEVARQAFAKVVTQLQSVDISWCSDRVKVYLLKPLSTQFKTSKKKIIHILLNKDKHPTVKKFLLDIVSKQSSSRITPNATPVRRRLGFL